MISSTMSVIWNISSLLICLNAHFLEKELYDIDGKKLYRGSATGKL